MTLFKVSYILSSLVQPWSLDWPVRLVLLPVVQEDLVS